MKGFFSYLHYENLVELQEVKLTNVVSLFPQDCIPLEFLTLRLIHTEAPTVHQLQLRFSYPPQLILAEVSAPVSCDSLYLPVYVSNI